MPFLGNPPADKYKSLAKQTITGDGSTAYTLNRSVTYAYDMEVFINNIRQEPDTSYSASGNTITFTAAVTSSDSCYLIYQGQSVGSINPPANSVGTTQIANNTVTTAHLHTGLSVPDSNIAAMAASKLTGDLAYNNMPPGSVIQFGNTVFETQETYSINGGSFGAYSGLTGSITPRFSNSKIYGIICLDGVTWTSDGSYGHFRVYRQTSGGDTEIQHFGYPRQWSSVDNSSGVNMLCHFYDAPAITTQVTYKFRFYSNSGTSNFNINRDADGDSTMTLMEVRL